MGKSSSYPTTSIFDCEARQTDQRFKAIRLTKTNKEGMSARNLPLQQLCYKQQLSITPLKNSAFDHH